MYLETRAVYVSSQLNTVYRKLKFLPFYQRIEVRSNYGLIVKSAETQESRYGREGGVLIALRAFKRGIGARPPGRKWRQPDCNLSANLDLYNSFLLIRLMTLNNCDGIEHLITSHSLDFKQNNIYLSKSKPDLSTFRVRFRNIIRTDTLNE